MKSKGKILVLGGSKGIGLEVIKFFNKSSVNTISVSRTKLDWKSKFNKEIYFDLLNFKNYENLIESLSAFNISSIIFNLGDGSLVHNDENKQYQYSLDINFNYVINFLRFIKDGRLNNVTDLILVNSICRFKSSKCRNDYHKSKSMLYKYFQDNVVSFSLENIRINSITLGDVYHDNSIWKNKFASKTDESEYLNKTKLNKKFVDVLDVVKTINFLLANKSIYGEDIIVDCGQSYLLNN